MAEWTGHEINQRTLDLAPINIDFGLMCWLISHGDPVRVILEPGDLTKYEFLIVPLVGQLSGTGHYEPGSLGFVPINNLTKKGSGGMVGVAPDFPPHWTDFSDILENPHSADVMAAFFSCLLEEIEERFNPQEVAHGDSDGSTPGVH